MRMSRYFLPVLKETPSEAQIVSHRYMLRAGMIKQSSAGIYSWLPLGYKVLKKIENIVHEEQQRAAHKQKECEQGMSALSTNRKFKAICCTSDLGRFLSFSDCSY